MPHCVWKFNPSVARRSCDGVLFVERANEFMYAA